MEFAMIKERDETVTDKYPTELTAEVITRLSAPVPASELQTKQQGGTTITFTSDKFVQRRLNDVVGVAGWQVDYSINSQAPVETRNGQIIGQVVCRLKVLDVMKSATADLELTKGMYGTPATNAQARSFKRAAMLFGIAAELWDKELAASDAEPAEEKVSQFKRPVSERQHATQKQGPSGVAGGPSPKQVDLLKDLHVPTKVIKKLSPGRNNSASTLITDLLAIKRKEDDYDDEPIGYIEDALKKIDRHLVALLDEEDDEEDED